MAGRDRYIRAACITAATERSDYRPDSKDLDLAACIARSLENREGTSIIRAHSKKDGNHG